MDSFISTSSETSLLFFTDYINIICMFNYE